MKTLRALFLMLLVLAVLPWGAFAAELSPRAPRDPAVTASAGGSAQPGAEASLSRRCSSPALPGSPCHPDNGLLPAPAAAPVSPPGHARPPDVIALQERGGPRGILDPPRMG